MQLRIPIKYTAFVKKPRSRTEEHMVFFEWLELPITQLEPFDAPIAAEWREELLSENERNGVTRDESKRYRSLGPTPEDGFLHTRWFSDAHWWPLLIKHEDEAREGLGFKASLAHLQRLVLSGKREPLPNISLSKDELEQYPFGRPLREEEFRSVRDCNREARIEDFKSALQRLALVDGYVYRKLPEPVYEIAAHSVIDRDKQGILRIVPYNDQSRSVATTWSLNAFDEAHEAAMNLSFLGRRSARSSLNTERRARILLPEALRADLDVKAIEIAAQEVIEAHSRTAMGKMTADEGIAYFQFRSALSSYEEDKDLDKLAEAAESYLAVGDAATTGSLRRLIDRYQFRPISPSK